MILKKRFLPALLVVFLFDLAAAAAAPVPLAGPSAPLPAGALKVGYGRADITPELGTPCALGLDDELLEVFDPLYVRAVWLEADGRAILILAGDVIGVYGADADAFTGLVGRAVGLPPRDILLTSTHTHQTANSRWIIGTYLRPFGLEEKFVSLKFKDQYVKGLIEAARQAKASAAACEMAYSEFPVEGIASNRRLPINDGQVEFRSSRANAEMRARPEGRIDPLLRAVLFRSLRDGSLIGLLNYNCHPTAAGGEELGYATGDFAGVGMTLAEAEMKGLRLLHLTGTAGEINPGKYVENDEATAAGRKREVGRLAERYARAILGAVNKASGYAPVLGLALARESFGLTLKGEVPSPAETRKMLAEAAEAYKKNKPKEGPMHSRIRGLSEEYALYYSRDGKLQTQAAALRLGDVFFTFMPGEQMLALGEELRDHFGRPHRLLNVTIALDYGTSYVVPQAYFDGGGYEPTATRMAPAAYVELREKMIELLRGVGLSPGAPGT